MHIVNNSDPTSRIQVKLSGAAVMDLNSFLSEIHVDTNALTNFINQKTLIRS